MQKNCRREIDSRIMAVYNTTPHHTTLLPEYRVAFIYYGIQDFDFDTLLNWLRKTMMMRDPNFVGRFVLDNENPDYVIATDKCFVLWEQCLRLKKYLRRNKNCIFVFFSAECVDPDLNIFDYAFTWNPDLKCRDRVTHNIPYICRGTEPGVITHTNSLTLEEARKILDSNPRFCNFIYSHESEFRDNFFHLLSQYKRVDSLGACLNNTGTKSTRMQKDWYTLSIGLKSGYKFTIAMENATYKGYTSEKIISSLQAHTVPIYWGDPAVAEVLNPKAFINCHDYSSPEEVIERVKEIDNDDDQWLDMVTQPWQTEEQRRRTLEYLSEYDSFVRHIFSQDLREARRRPEGEWPSLFTKGFTGAIGVMPPLYHRLKSIAGKLLSQNAKKALKRFLRVN